MKKIQCQGCSEISDVPLEDGRQPDMPVGWVTVTVAERGQPIRNTTICPECNPRLISALLR